MKLPLKTRLIYAVLWIADVLTVNTIASFLRLFYTTAYQIPPGWIAAIQPVIKVVDVATNPLMGQISDNTRSRMGRRRPWILLGGIACAVVFALLWAPQYLLFWAGEPSRVLVFAYFTVFYSLYFITHTIYQVPYNALGAELSPDYDGRTKVFALRHLISRPAIPLVMLTYWAANNKAWFTSEKSGMVVSTVVVAAIMIALVCITTFGTKEEIETQSSPKTGLKDSLRVALTNRPLVVLSLSGFLYVIGYLFAFEFANYLLIYGVFAGDKFAASNLLFWGTIATVTVGLLVNILIRRLAGALGKRTAFILCMACGFLIPLVSLVAFNPEHPYRYFLFPLIMPLGITGIEILPLAIIGDICDLDEVKHRRRRTGAFNGAFTSLQKAGLSLAPTITMLCLVLCDFNGSLREQTSETIRRFRIALFGVSLVMALMAFALALAFPLRREDVEAAQLQLAQRREAAGTAAVS